MIYPLHGIGKLKDGGRGSVSDQRRLEMKFTFDPITFASKLAFITASIILVILGEVSLWVPILIGLASIELHK